MERKYVYPFEECGAKVKRLVGNKGAHLGEMMSMGLPIPPGFTISTEACMEYLNRGNFPEGLEDEVRANVKLLEKKTGKGFGGKDPLLVSVRSGSTVSMPGMMDTVLNLGLNDETVQWLSETSGDGRFALDAYRRFIQMFGSIVLGIERERFEERLSAIKKQRGMKADSELKAEDLERAVKEYKDVVAAAGHSIPSDPVEQLHAGVRAVFNSWNGRRCVEYRRQFNITPDIAMGTAVNVQTMVFGNLGDDSATGVAFTRDPGTGANEFYGEYLTKAQGEDVVAGARTPRPLRELKKEMPRLYDELEGVRNNLEKRYKEVQDLEFTIERGRLYVLQTRTGKMNARATLKTSIDMCNEGLISKERAVLRLNPDLLEQLFHPQIEPGSRLEEKGGKTWLRVGEAKFPRLGKGLGASPGAASGKVVFSADDAEAMGKRGEKLILVREETKPDDIHGFFAALGVLTSRGGMTSHAAVVARGIGKPCVAGLESMRIDERARSFTIEDTVVKEGDEVTLDGTTGSVYLGNVPLVDSELIRVLTDKMPAAGSELFKNYEQMMAWVDGSRRLKVRANTDTPEGASKARRFGAEGIGLCRTERMFNDPDRLPIVRKMILAKDADERRAHLDQLLPLQKDDFEKIIRAMEGLPVTIRLLDPPLHEFLPRMDELLVEIHELESKGGDRKVIAEKRALLESVRALWEVNPMLGHRGVRLGITHPDIYEMQVKAILMAAGELAAQGLKPHVEMMIPNVGSVSELRFVKEHIVDKVVKELNSTVHFAYGTMAEVVRLCVTADKIADIAEFFSFGTNDLTQGTFSFSREDAEKKFLHPYLKANILWSNPFAILDRDGVGELMRIAVQKGRKTRPSLKVGICGEHGGEPSSVEFCHSIGLDYVSCSPFRVPIARLAAAHGALKELQFAEQD